MRPSRLPAFMFWCIPLDNNTISVTATETNIYTSEYIQVKFASSATTKITISMGDFLQTYQTNPDTFIVDKYYYIYLHPNIETLFENEPIYLGNSTINGPNSEFTGYNQDQKIPIDQMVKGNVLKIKFEDPSLITKLNLTYIRSNEFPEKLNILTNLNTLNFTALAPLISYLPPYLFNMTKISSLVLDRFADPNSELGKSIPNEVLKMPLTQFSWIFQDELRDRSKSNIEGLSLLSGLEKFTFSPDGTAYFFGDWFKDSVVEHVVYYLCNIALDIEPENNPTINFDPSFKESPKLKLVTYDSRILNSKIFETFDSPHITNAYFIDRGGDLNNTAPTKIQMDGILSQISPFGDGNLVYISLLERASDQTYRDSYMMTYITSFYDSILSLTASKGIEDLSGVQAVFSKRYGSTNYPIDGVYQQPSDWNGTTGTPQSSLERIWVLINKYNMTIVYT